ncbi:hypothetical protein Y032_0167g110 [Ancylostoma ceylanicum]|uniref:G-protein coupled receptors family 1 profile domain-containing protein n=1 Tax=Ancylostoma ceylanicum TaxID=53326 RepID=A0A016SWP0_9BILA|nr:hypothetical protein Y032_0167g110 [Ancylostoma ceylanicum]
MEEYLAVDHLARESSLSIAKSLSAFKYFFFLFGIVDIFFSVVQAAFVPITVGEHTSFVFLSVGLLRSRECGFVGLLLFIIGCIFVLLLICNSFLYRYVVLCRPNLTHLYARKRYVAMVVALNSVLILDWGYSVHRTMPATAEFTATFRPTVLNIVQIDIFNTAHFGFNTKDLQRRPLDIIWFSQFVIIMLLVIVTIVYCVFQILETLKRTVISSNARKLHSRMFNLLILQLLNPVVFMYLPCMMSYILVPVNAMNVDYICTLTYSSFAVFPLVNPMIILHYVRDYRVYLLRLLRLDNSTLRHKITARST